MSDLRPKAARDLDEYVRRHNRHPELEAQREPVLLEAGTLDDLMAPGTDRFALEGEPGPRLGEVANLASLWWNRTRHLVGPLLKAKEGKLGSPLLRALPWDELDASSKTTVVRAFWEHVLAPTYLAHEVSFTIDPLANLARLGGRTEPA
jgi:hypothetical protein